jgi:RNA polymerase sigma-70 factor, ECF subfamily
VSDPAAATSMIATTAMAAPAAGAPPLPPAPRAPAGDADVALVAASRAGDSAAFEELVKRTARLVYARAYLETGDRHRAEDLWQETFLTAWRKLDQLTDPTGFRPWVLTILHSVLVDSIRRAGRKKRRGGDASRVGEMLRLADASPTPAESAQANEERRRALSVLRSMPREYQQVLMLRYFAGADYDTIARQLALTNGSLRGLLHRGLAMLRKQLEGK